MDIKNEIVRILDEIGIDSSDSQQLININSIQYITIIVEIEQLLEIELPDFILESTIIEDLDVFVNTIINIYRDKEKIL